eukprot:196290_1
MSVNFRVSNKWSNQQIRKKIRNKRQIRQYYKTKNKDKPFKSKYHKSKSISLIKLYHCDINSNNNEPDSEFESKYINSNNIAPIAKCGCYKPERAALNWTKVSVIRPLFDFIDHHINKYDSMSFPIHFPSDAHYLQQLIFDCLYHLCYSKCIDIENCNDISIKCLIKELMYSYEQCGEWCGECYTDPDRYGFIWDQFCIDLNTVIYETKKKIKSMQLRDLTKITNYTQTDSKQNWSKYVCKIIDINGINQDICALILDFVSYEYLMLFHRNLTTNKFYRNPSKDIMQRSIVETTKRVCYKYFSYPYPTDDIIFILRDYGYNIWILHESKDTIIGLFACDTYDFGYFWCELSDSSHRYSIKFYDEWILLSHAINSVSMKIDCYKSISDCCKSISYFVENIIKQKVINQELKRKRKSIRKQANKLLFDKREIERYDYKVRAQRKYLTKRIKMKMHEINVSDISVRKRIFRRENRHKKYAHMTAIRIRNNWRIFMKYRKHYNLVYGYIHCIEKQYTNIHCELRIPIDIFELIFAMYSKLTNLAILF